MRSFFQHVAWLCLVGLLGCGGDVGGKKPDGRDAGAGPKHDDAGGKAECFITDECDKLEFCSADHVCEPLGAAGAACKTGLECQSGLYCLRTYEAAGLCKPVPASCPDDICKCWTQDSQTFCDGQPNNCDLYGRGIYCTKLR